MTEPRAQTPRPATSAADGRPLAAQDWLTAPLARHLSHQERVNAILETGRKRAESTGHASGPGSPRLQPLLAPRPPSPGTVREVGSGDEDPDHGLVMRPAQRQSAMSYHSTDTNSPASNSAVPRRSKSALSQKSLHCYRAEQQASADAAQRSTPATASGADRKEARNAGRVGGFLRMFQSMELENKASVARDHLALERTFLAWLRTSLAFASIGIAITQLFRLNTSLAGDAQGDTLRHVGKPLGATFLAISVLILLLGYVRFLTCQQWLLRGKFPASRATIVLVTLIAFAVTLASLIVVVAVRNGLQ